MADNKVLEKLCSLYGISGNEEAVRDWILQQITPYVTTIEIDALGNLIAFKKGEQPAKTKLMLSAHMDEVGLIVTHITDEGLLKFTTVGGIDKRVLCGKQVWINGHYGVIGGKPIHLMKGDEREKAVPVEELSIDIGAGSKEEAEQAVSLGDVAGFVSTFDQEGNKIRGRALDDRVGCTILIDLIKRSLPYDMTFVFCVQEEIGLRGARTAAYSVNPQAAIVVESLQLQRILPVWRKEKKCAV